MNQKAAKRTTVTNGTTRSLLLTARPARRKSCWGQKVWKWIGRGAKNGVVLAREFNEKRYADGCYENREFGPVAQRPIS